jgi:hypothetical protein
MKPGAPDAGMVFNVVIPYNIQGEKKEKTRNG